MKKVILLMIAVGFMAQAFADEDISATSTSETNYPGNFQLRSERKLGVGATIGGALGVVGLISELNLEKENSAMVGLGAGPGYNSFLLSWKRSFEGTYVTPYTLLGYSHWFGDGSQGNPRQSAILEQVLSDSEKSSGNFGKNFFAGSLGLQYNHLQGDLAGLSFLIQFDLMGSLDKSNLMLSGGLASIYYF